MTAHNTTENKICINKKQHTAIINKKQHTAIIDDDCLRLEDDGVRMISRWMMKLYLEKR